MEDDNVSELVKSTPIDQLSFQYGVNSNNRKQKVKPGVEQGEVVLEDRVEKQWILAKSMKLSRNPGASTDVSRRGLNGPEGK